jgi:hypothetical protein
MSSGFVSFTPFALVSVGKLAAVHVAFPSGEIFSYHARARPRLNSRPTLSYNGRCFAACPSAPSSPSRIGSRTGTHDYRLEMDLTSEQEAPKFSDMLRSCELWLVLLLLAGGTPAFANPLVPRPPQAEHPLIIESQLRSCGSRGGPGWRGPDGRCVGRKNLNRVCGVPPETKCTAEGATGFATGGAIGLGAKPRPRPKAQ